MATSVNLRCYLLLVPRNDWRVILHLPDFFEGCDIERSWSIDELEAIEGEEETQIQSLKKISDSDGLEIPEIPSLAILVFLYLLVTIYNTKLK